MKEIEQMTNKELAEEIKAYHHSIDKLGCYEMKDLVMRRLLEEEANTRGLNLVYAEKGDDFQNYINEEGETIEEGTLIGYETEDELELCEDVYYA